MPPDAAIDGASGAQSQLSPEWRSALGRLVLAWAAVIVVTAREWGEILHQWWNIETYNHIVLVPAIIAWLAWMRRYEVLKTQPKAWWPGLLMLVAALALWIAGRVTGINLFAHAGAVAALQAAFVALFGVRVSTLLLLPLGMMVFLVPFGDEIIPPLQFITAKIAIVLTQWSGIPASIEGIYIDTPAGLFIVAEACSGVKFLIAMIALGVLVCFTAFESWAKRAAFMLAAIIVPIIANGIRAWGTIFIAQSQGVEFAEGFDHIVYGWVFFAIVIALLIGGAWRFFERDPEDAGYTYAEIASSPFLTRLEQAAMPFPIAFGAILGIAALTALAADFLTG